MTGRQGNSQVTLASAAWKELPAQSISCSQTLTTCTMRGYSKVVNRSLELFHSSLKGLRNARITCGVLVQVYYCSSTTIFTGQLVPFWDCQRGLSSIQSEGSLPGGSLSLVTSPTSLSSPAPAPHCALDFSSLIIYGTIRLITADWVLKAAIITRFSSGSLSTSPIGISAPPCQRPCMPVILMGQTCHRLLRPS